MAAAVARALIGMFCNFGALCIMQLDNGTEFANAVIQYLAEGTGIKNAVKATLQKAKEQRPCRG
ncbi:hypothetical protein H4S08_004442 [Coemansia sp. RSA 1365]|nr:hypothetical protein H4S08_004442 [Coemansia sp. RSA 1365]